MVTTTCLTLIVLANLLVSFQKALRESHQYRPVRLVGRRAKDPPPLQTMAARKPT